MIGNLTEELEYFKMAGAGNDFILIDNRRGGLKEEDCPELARQLCRRQQSLGADGMIVLDTSKLASVKMNYYNSDGSVGELCGNGARCAARLANLRVMAAKRMTIETGAGIIQAEVLDGREVQVQMPQPVDERLNVELEIGAKLMNGQYCKVGVPHVVFFLKDIDALNLVRLGAAIRHHAAFAPGGANVHFAQQVGGGLRLRSYERGVEAETLACGTGAVATAYFAARLFGQPSPVPIAVRSGALLTVHFTEEKNGALGNFELQGETRVISRGKITPEALLPSAARGG